MNRLARKPLFRAAREQRHLTILAARVLGNARIPMRLKGGCYFADIRYSQE